MILELHEGITMSEGKQENKTSMPQSQSRPNMWILLGVFIFGILLSASFFILNTQRSQQQIEDISADVQEGTMIASLVTATKIDSNNVLLWIQLGNAYYDTAQVKLAIEAYRKALELNPHMPEVLIDYATMLRADFQLEESKRAYDKALSLSKDNSVALYNKGLLLYYDLKNTSEAIQTWERLISQSPHARTPDGRLIQALLAEMKK